MTTILIGRSPDTPSTSNRPQKRSMREAFREEALPHRDGVERLARHLMKDSASAEDLVQDTFVHAWRGFRNFRIGSNCRAWLLRICRNLFYDRLRERRRRPVPATLEGLDPAASSAPVTGVTDLSEVLSDEVHGPLNQLSSEFREVVILADIADLTYHEITEVLGVPTGTVRSRLSRARAVLRERLAGYAREMGLAASA